MPKRLCYLISYEDYELSRIVSKQYDTIIFPNMHHLTPTSIARVISKLPPHITTIDFSYVTTSGKTSTLFQFIESELQRQGKTFPPHIKKIILIDTYWRGFHVASKFQETQEAINTLKIIPKTVTELAVFNSGLFSCTRSESDIDAILAAIPQQIQFLYLGDDIKEHQAKEDPADHATLVAKQCAQAAYTCMHLPANITRLDLSYYASFQISNEHWATILQAIPPQVTHLDLGEIFYSSRECQAIISNIPRHIRYLSLKEHPKGHFPQKTDAEKIKSIRSCLQSFAGTLVELDLSECDLSDSGKRALTQQYYEKRMSGLTMMTLGFLTFAFGATAVALVFFVIPSLPLSAIMLAGHVISSQTAVSVAGCILSGGGLFAMREGYRRREYDVMPEPTWIARPE